MTDIAETPSITAETAPEAAKAPKSLRRRRGSVGGLALKLDAPQRPGFVRRFVLNDPSRIAHMHELGYDFAQEKAGEGSRRTQGQGTRIERHAGKDQNGAPTRLVLMETPVSEFEVGVAEKEERLKPFEEAIRSSADTTGEVENAYVPSTRSSINRG